MEQNDEHIPPMEQAAPPPVVRQDATVEIEGVAAGGKAGGFV